jgi:hypothetical protein
MDTPDMYEYHRLNYSTLLNHQSKDTSYILQVQLCQYEGTVSCNGFCLGRTCGTRIYG